MQAPQARVRNLRCLVMTKLSRHEAMVAMVDQCQYIILYYIILYNYIW